MSQRREYGNGATGDCWVYDAEEDRWEPTGLEDVAVFAALAEDVEEVTTDLADEVTSREEEDLDLQTQLDALRADYRRLLKAWILVFGFLPELGDENNRALAQQ